MAAGGEGPLRFCPVPPIPGLSRLPLQGLLAFFLSQATGEALGQGVPPRARAWMPPHPTPHKGLGLLACPVGLLASPAGLPGAG